MQYRKLGNTGLTVSEIGMGCEGFIGKTPEEVMEFIDTMEELGMNVIDMYSPNPDFRSNLGKALQGRRDKFILQAHLCTYWDDTVTPVAVTDSAYGDAGYGDIESGQYKRTRNIDEVKAGFEDLMERLGTDRFEIGMIHYVDAISDWNEIVNGEVMKYAKQLKKDGVIGCIGISSHNPDVALAAVESGLVEVIMFSVNPCYDLMPASENIETLFAPESYENQLVNMEPKRQKLYELCHQKGIGIHVMKAFGGGILLDGNLSPAGKTLTLHQCLHYALTRPGVGSIMSGARSIEELRYSAAYFDVSDEEKDFASAFAEFPKISWSGHCMYCGHCAPCPMGIDVAMTTKLLNLSVAQGETPETVREHYKVLPHKASECISCGACEKRCPFEVAVIENMKKAVEVFGE